MKRRHNVTPILAIGMLAVFAFGGKLEEDGDYKRDMRLVMDGTRLREGPAALEEAVKANPEDEDDRVRLLGYYFMHRFKADDQQARASHILWLINNRPQKGVLTTIQGRFDKVSDQAFYIQGKEAWDKQVAAHPEDVKVLRNAAAYLMAEGPRSEEYLKKGQKLDGSDPYWRDQLAFVYLNDMNKAAITNKAMERSGSAHKALAELEKAQEMEQLPVEQFKRLRFLAETALEAKEEDKAKGYAEKLLKDAPKFRNTAEAQAKKLDSGSHPKQNSHRLTTLLPEYGDLLHHAHVVLGRVALRKGDLNEAKKQLDLAGDVPSAPGISSFGPNMMLARELLVGKETDAVLKYFDQVGKIWKNDGGKLKEWAEAVKKGKVPDFGANLVF